MLRMPGVRAIEIGLCLIIMGPSFYALAQTVDGEWPTYGGDLRSSKYAPHDQINADNFADLEIAWRWKSVDDVLSLTTNDGEWIGKSSDIFAALQEENPDRWRSGREPGN